MSPEKSSTALPSMVSDHPVLQVKSSTGMNFFDIDVQTDMVGQSPNALGRLESGRQWPPHRRLAAGGLRRRDRVIASRRRGKCQTLNYRG